MRKFMLATTFAALIALGGCTAAQITQTAANIEGDIQASTAAACNIIPTVATIASIAATVFGQPNIAALTIAAEQAIVSEICTAAPPPASARLRALPSPGNVPVAIGKSKNGVIVSGWKA